MHIRQFFNNRWLRRLLRFFLVASFTFLFLLGISSLLFYFNQDHIKRSLLRYVQQHQEGELSIGAIRFSPLTHLPDLAIRVNKVIYYEHPAPGRSAEEMPILHVERAYLAFNVISLLSGKYEVRELTLRNGRFNLRFYPDNTVNLLNAVGIHQQVKKELISYGMAPSPRIDLTLKTVRLENLTTHVLHERNELAGKFVIRQLKAGLRYREGKKDMQLTSQLTCHYLSMGEEKYLRDKKVDLDLDLLLDDRTMVSRIRRSRLIFEGLAFDLEGTYDFKKSGWADLSLEASDADLTLFSYLVEDNILDRNLTLPDQGTLFLRGNIRGKTINHLPEVSFRFGADQVRLHIPGRKESIENLRFSGFFNTGAADNFSESEFRIDHLSGDLPGGHVSGMLEVVNFADPSLTASCRLRGDMEGWDEVFKLGGIDSLSGAIDLDFDVENWRLASGDTPEKINAARLEIRDGAFHLPAFKHRFEGLYGSFFMQGDAVELRGGRFRYAEGDFSLNGEMRNVVAALTGLAASPEGRFRLQSSRCRLDIWPFSSALSPVIARSPIRDFIIDVSLKNEGEPRDGFPWTSALRVNVHQLEGCHEKFPDLKAFHASAFLNRRENGVLRLGIKNMKSRLSGGELNLRDASFWVGKRSLTGDAFVEVKKLRFSQFRDKLPDGALSFADIEMESRIDAEFKFRGIYDWRSRKIDTLSVVEGKLSYQPEGAAPLVLEEVDFQIQEAAFQNGGKASRSRPFLAARLAIGRLQTEHLEEMRIKCAVTGQADYYFFRGGLYQLSDVVEEGTIEVDLSGRTPSIHLAYSLDNFPVESALQNFNPTPLLSGRVDFSVDVRTWGTGEASWVKNASGVISLEGENLTLHGIDLKKRLEAMPARLPGKLVDLGAYFLLHPLGDLLIGDLELDQAFALQPREGKITRVSRLISAWEFRNGRLESRDVALRFPQGQIAVDASLNMQTDSIEQFTVAVVNSKGRPLLRQMVAGAFADPQRSGIIRQMPEKPGQAVFYNGSLNKGE